MKFNYLSNIMAKVEYTIYIFKKFLIALVLRLKINSSIEKNMLCEVASIIQETYLLHLLFPLS